jgi:addiction module RelE/StbE family toxin
VNKCRHQYSIRFKKDYKLRQKRNYAMPKLLTVMGDLENATPLSPQLKEHPLQGKYFASKFKFAS